MAKKILLVGLGSTARADCLAEAIAKSADAELFAFLQHKNPGVLAKSKKTEIGRLDDLPALKQFAKEVKADLAVISPEAALAFGAVDALAGVGVPSFGPTKSLARLETSKSFTRSLMLKYGIEGNPEHEVFPSEEGLRDYLLGLGTFVVKPDGLTGGKGVKVFGEHLKSVEDALDYSRGLLAGGTRVIVEEKLEGEEFSLQCITDGKTVAACPAVQDHKRAYEGDFGPNCYSEDTEVLTESGWKTFDKLKYKTRVAIYQPRFNRIRFETPKSIYWKPYSGKMVSLRHREVDLLVTPNHRMLIKRRKGKQRYEVTEAKDLKGEFFIPQTGIWIGTTKKFMVLPKSANHYGPKRASIRIAFDTWAEFLGLFLSEGYASRERVYICQSKNSEHFDSMKRILRKLPFPIVYEKDKFRINSVQLSASVRSFGHSHEKYVPDYIKRAKPAIIEKFLASFCMGDGDIHRGQKRFCSSSKRLIDDLQDLLLKTGKVGVITVDRRNKMLNPINHKYCPARPIYSIEVKKRLKTSIRKNNISSVDYSGFIGCVTVSTGFVVVRRNNRVAICGNTGGMGSYSSANHLLPFLSKEDVGDAKEITEKVAAALYKEVGEYYKGVMYGGFMVTAGGVKLIEYNARFGDPEIMNVLPLLENDFVEVCEAVVEQRLSSLKLSFSQMATVCKYAVPEGYPENPKKNGGLIDLTSLHSFASSQAGSKYYFGSVEATDKPHYFSMGTSRAVACLGVAPSIEQAERIAEEAVGRIRGPVRHRRDIGTSELLQKRVRHVNELRKRK